jgi:uncharacterized RDD family membrane protein YckC
VAVAVDWFWKALISAVLLFLTAIVLALLGAGGMIGEPPVLLVAAVVTVLYALWLGYAIYYEVRWNGQTPGKRIAGIRAIREGGAPIDFRTACVRNLLAVADFLPAFHLLGAVLILLTHRRQRLGDMAAGTVVIRERAVTLGADPTAATSEYASDEFTFTPAQLAALTPADRALLREFLRREPEMTDQNRDSLAVRLAAKYIQKTGCPQPADLDEGDTATVFLASLLRDLEDYLRHA